MEEFSPFVRGELTLQDVVILLGWAAIVGDACFSACLEVTRDFQEGCLSRSAWLACPRDEPMKHISRLILSSEFLVEQACNHFKGGVGIVRVILEFLDVRCLRLPCQPQSGFSSQILFCNAQISGSRAKGKEPFRQGAFREVGEFCRLHGRSWVVSAWHCPAQPAQNHSLCSPTFLSHRGLVSLSRCVALCFAGPSLFATAALVDVLHCFQNFVEVG